MVTKSHDDLFLRRANSQLGERGCVNADKCVCRWLAIFRYGEETDKAFVCREFLLPSQLDEFKRSGRLPKAQGKCLLCCRYFSSYVYTLARTSPNFCPKSCIAVQAFGNVIGCSNPEDEAVSFANDVGSTDGYKPEAMLFADERWTATAASRGELGTLLWRPVVRFNSGDYVFVNDAETGEVRIVQINVGVTDTVGQDFGRPPHSMTVRVEASTGSPQRSTA